MPKPYWTPKWDRIDQEAWIDDQQPEALAQKRAPAPLPNGASEFDVEFAARTGWSHYYSVY